jgi:hypothetical protein
MGLALEVRDEWDWHWMAFLGNPEERQQASSSKTETSVARNQKIGTKRKFRGATPQSLRLCEV